MATTTNYGWTTPDDTALVKDGASAIRTLGTAIDTTVFNNASAGIAKTIVDAKGDIIAATAADVVARLAVGTNGQVLTAASGETTGLQWATPSSGGYTLLSTTTLSSTTTTISSISGSYTDLMVIINNPYTNTGGQIEIRPNATSTISYNSGTVGGSAESSSHMRGGTLPTTSTPKNTYYIFIRQYAQATYGKSFQFGGGIADSANCTNKAGFIDTTSAISSIAITTSSGTATFSGGQVLIYGVK